MGELAISIANENNPRRMTFMPELQNEYESHNRAAAGDIRVVDDAYSQTSHS